MTEHIYESGFYAERLTEALKRDKPVYGEPKGPSKLFHGTILEFQRDQIQPSKSGLIWLTNTEKTAKGFLRMSRSTDSPKEAKEGKGNIFEYYLKPDSKILVKNHWDGVDSNKLVKEAKEKNADVIAIRKVRDIPETEDQYYILVNPSKLALAIETLPPDRPLRKRKKSSRPSARSIR